VEASIRLMVVSERPSDSLIRLFWNCEDDGVLSGRVAEGDIFELGETRVVTPEEPDAPGPAGRVFSLISYLGTIDTYTLPRIDDLLIGLIMLAFRSAAPEDQAFSSAEPDQLERFLSTRRRMYLFVEG
jgi:hypothetical protein